jgi:ribosomal protein S19
MRCMATVGQVGNLDHENQNHRQGRPCAAHGPPPQTRGVAMTPRDHPHGGGEGKSPTGMPPKTPWGQPAMGHRTRRNKRPGSSSCAPGTARATGEEQMSRSLKKGPFVEARLLSRAAADEPQEREEGAQDLVARQRHLPDFVGHTDRRLQRPKHIPVFVTENMVGHRLGEFAPTRTFRGHGKHTERSTALK